MTQSLIEGIQHRNLPAGGTLQIREAEDGAREVSGIGVPYNDPIEFWGIREQFAPGSVEVAENAKLLYRHNEPIGLILDHHSDDAGWHHRSRISKTPTGDEAYTLARDGVIDRFSIGFKPIEHLETKDDDGTITITHTKVLVREVSLVPFPAYDGAALTEVRHQQKEEPMTASTIDLTEDVAEIREGLDDLTRSVALLADTELTPTEPVEERSIGALLKAAIKEDETAIASLQRATDAAFAHRDYDGGTVADAIAKDAWVGDLTRILEGTGGVHTLFATGALPKEGMSIEYGQLKTDTTQVTEQAAEGDDLAFGKVSVETKTAPVKTYGGYSTLSRQEIERTTNINMLNLTLRAMAAAAGKRQKAAFQTHYAAAVSAQRTANNTVDVPAADATYTDWLNAIVDAALKYEDLELSLSGLIVSAATFKELLALNAEDGRPLFVVSGQGVNTVGSLDTTALKGDLASVQVRLNPRAARNTPEASFFHTNAIRSYQSGLARLQDENIVNLTSSFSVYRYAAIANEIPAGIVPVKRTGA